MISKRIRRDKAKSNFTRLGRYILEAKNHDAAVLWTRTADYILNDQGRAKVAWWRISHCESDLPGLAIAEIRAVQEKNKRAQTDKTYHLVVSFPDGEQPTREQLEDIEDALCSALGFAEHQRLSAVHQDTGNWHIHIAVNKVHPRTLRCIEPYNDYYVRDSVCRQLEQKHGLQHDNGIDKSATSDRAGDMEAHTGQESLLRWIKDNAGAELTACREQGANWQAMHATLARFNLAIRPRGAGGVIVHAGSRLAVKASRVDRALSFKSLTARWGAFEPPTAPNQTPAGASLGESSPAQVSQAPANPGLPSDPSPAPSPPNQPPPERQYRRAPLHPHPRTEPLYTDYQRQREAARQARQAARTPHRQAHDHYADELKAWYAERRQDIRRNERLPPLEKRTAYKELARRRRQDGAQRRQAEADQRKAIAEAHPLPTWQGYLQAAAERGDESALAVLRSRDARQRRLAANLLTAADAHAARQIVFAHLTPRARKNGTMVYHLEDGGVVADETRQVRVEQVTAGACILALLLANERFPGQPLIIEGTDEFKGQVMQVAARFGLASRLADALEAPPRTRPAPGPRPPPPDAVHGPPSPAERGQSAPPGPAPLTPGSVVASRRRTR